MPELRDSLPKPWLISMATTVEPASYGQGFGIPAFTPIVDFFNVTACANCASYSWNYGTDIKQRINQQGWVNHTDPEAGGSPDLTNSTIPGFNTHDSIASTSRKVRYVKSREFGGVFTWELSADCDGKSPDPLNAMLESAAIELSVTSRQSRTAVSGVESRGRSKGRFI
jgi:GH18 family chitinase